MQGHYFTHNKLFFSCLSLCLTTSYSLQATSATPAEDVMVVTASGYEQKLTDAAASISVVNQQELQRKKYNDLAEALDDVEGLDIRSSTGKTGGLDIRIRGMRSKDTLILIDGRRQTNTSDVTPNGFGTMNTNFMPPLSAIERIEVIRGPMSTLYGSDAIGGVVNIITKKVSPFWQNDVTLDHTFQEKNTYGDSSQFSFYSRGPLIEKKLGLALRGSLLHRQASRLTFPSSNVSIGNQSKGVSPVKGDVYDLGTKLTWSIDPTQHLWLEGETAKQKYDNSHGQLGSLSRGYTTTMHYERQQLTLGYDRQFSFGLWNSSINWQQTKTLGRTLPADALSKRADPKYANTPRELNNTEIIVDSKLVAPLGEDHLLNIGGQFSQARMRDGIVLVNQGAAFKQHAWALFTEDEWRLLEPLALTYGARYEYNNAFHSHLSPRAYLVWDTSKQWTLKGGVSTGYKTPTPAQLNAGVNGVTRQGTRLIQGNPQLKPEESVNTEIGAYYQHFSGFNGNATLFHNRLTNMISSKEVLCTDPDNCVPGFGQVKSYNRPINLGKAQTQGIELALTLPLIKAWKWYINYTYTDAEQKGDNKGAPLSNTPRHMLNSKLSWDITPKLATWLKMEYRGHMPRFNDAVDKLTGENKVIYDLVGAHLQAYTLWQLGAAYKINEQFTINATVNNVLNKDFSEAVTYIDSKGDTQYIGKYFSSGAMANGSAPAGRNYWVSLNIKF